MAIGGVHDFTPDAAADLLVAEIRIDRGNLVHLCDQFTEHFDCLALGEHFLITLACLRIGNNRIAVQDIRNHAHELTVVGNNQKIQGRLDLNAGAMVGMDNRQASRIVVGRVRVRRLVAHQEGIRRVGGVQVRIAPEYLALRNRFGRGPFGRRRLRVFRRYGLFRRCILVRTASSQ